MTAVALALVALCQLGLFVIALRTLRRTRSWDWLIPTLVAAALVYDNAILALGTTIGEGDVLHVLSMPRYAGHALGTPLLVMFAFTCASRFGIARFSRREAATGWGFVVYIAIMLGVLDDVVKLHLAPEYEHGLLSYGHTSAGGPPIKEIVTVVCLLLLGGAIARYGRSHWMFLGAAAMFVIAAFWASDPVLSNTGELLLLAGIVATGLRSLRAEEERRAARKRGARQRAGAPALLGPAGGRDDNERAERKRRSTRWNRYLGVGLAVAFPGSYLLGWWHDNASGTLGTWVATADVLVQGVSTALLITHAVYSFSVFGFPNPRWNLRTINGYISYALLFTYMLSQLAFDTEPAHTVLLAVSLVLIAAHVVIALRLRRGRPAPAITFRDDVRTVVAADSYEVGRVRGELAGTAPGEVVVAARRASVSLGGTEVLADVDLEVLRGEVVALIGNNGAGKTTLLRTLAGLQAPARGRIEYHGVDVSRASAAARARLGVSLVVGGHAVFGTMTVEENLRVFARRIAGRHEAVDGGLEAVYDEFPWIAERRDQLAGTLSGGQHQMLAVAQGLIGDPEILMIDEFSLGLAPSVVDQLAAMVRTINARGTAVLVVEQSVPVALDLATRAYVLDRGRIALSGTRDELLADPARVTDVLMHAHATTGA
ncbi:ABC transporter ATP-binding protein [Nocardioides sp. YIM 152588]|uniref:ABC transporter ATP-binding protein n=1 Tax=Nocardioides sp. YIM 152588 TaxID=3158259 RepID=UPI0032E4A6D7